MATSRSEPTDEEMAAILAAYQVLQRTVVVAADDSSASTQPAWRFSGRWWARPVAARRVRPWA